MEQPLLLLLASPALALQPAESATRTIIPLDGVWRLTVNNRSINIAVPSSFDELVEGLPEGYSGPAVYHRDFRVPAAFRGQRLVLRFDSANYRAAVHVDGTLLTTHEFAGMPFEAELPASAADAGVHTLSVTVDVVRSWQTLPPGLPATHYGVPVVLTWDGLYGFGGLDGRVRLLAMPPRAFVADVSTVPSLDDGNGTTARLAYSVVVAGPDAARVTVFAMLAGPWRPAGEPPPPVVATASGANGSLVVPNACLWEPLPGTPCLYTLTVRLHDNATAAHIVPSTLFERYALVDEYSLRVGLRTVEVRSGKLLLNGKPLYLRGIHMHGDSPLRGRGDDDVHNLVDVQSLVAAHANWVRIHPPPSEALLDLLDEAGILVSAEVPAIGMRSPPGLGGDAFAADRINGSTLAAHIRYVKEYVARDKNRACVLLWSVANEPATDEAASEPYFGALLNASRALDPQRRPLTYVTNRDVANDLAARHVDLLCVNRYYGWYTDGGSAYVPKAEQPPASFFLPTPPAAIASELAASLRSWRTAYPQKPLLVSEYGAGSLTGLHARAVGAGAPSEYSSELRDEIYDATWAAFDELRAAAELQGEQLHALHDFKQYGRRTTDVGGLNLKGLYTRERAPKDGARARLAERYRAVAAGACAPEVG